MSIDEFVDVVDLDLLYKEHESFLKISARQKPLLS